MNKKRHIKLAVLCAITMGSILYRAHGDLIVTVKGAVGTDTTTWTFSGDYTGSALHEEANYYSTANPHRSTALNYFSHVSGNLTKDLITTGLDQTLVFSQSTAIVVGSSTGSHTIDGIFLSDDDPTYNQSDDFAWYGTGSFSSTAETLTFSGTATLNNFDISNFAGISMFGDTSSISSTSEMTPFTVSVEAIPEPATATFISLFGIGMLIARRIFGSSLKNRF